MRRRSFLVATAAAAVALAGCSSSASSDASQSDLRIAFKQSLEDNTDIQIDYLEWEDDKLLLEYTTTASTQNELVDEVRAVAGTYAGAYDANTVEMERFEVWVFDDDDSLIVTYHIEPDWALDFMAEEISADEYESRIGDTMQ